jgi:hypothetical protein
MNSRVLMVVMIATTQIAAAPASDPKALRILAECQAATGGPALDRPDAFRETGTMTRDGKAGSYETFGDLRSLRSSSSQTFDGKTRRAGFDGQASWRVGADGAVNVAADDQTLRGERLGTYLTLSGYLYPKRFPATFRYIGRRVASGRAYDVVSATPEQADSVQLWIDAKTHRLAHLEASSDGQSIVGDVSDYRLVAGTWVGFALRIVQGGHEVRLRLSSFSYIPRKEALFRGPATDR